MDLINKIKRWMETFGQTVNTVPTVPEVKKRELGYNLIDEEFKEFKQEIFTVFMEDLDAEFLRVNQGIDLVGVADSLGDLLWVVVWNLYLYGLDPDKVIDTIYKSNMSKLCKTREEAELTVELYKTGEHPTKIGKEIDCYIEQVNEYYAVKRLSDNKILKSVNYEEPDWSWI